MKKIDLNVDIGEGFPYDRELLRLATSANVCCGEHSGSWDLTLETIELCKEAGVRIGMHPGFPDREGFGRRMPEVAEAKGWQQSLYDQAARFEDACEPAYLKPHGAWYGTIFDLERCADWNAVWMTICREQELMLMAPGIHSIAVGGLVSRLKERGFRFILEGFAERRYDENYRLVARERAGALLTNLDEIGAQALRLAPQCDSLCIHGDSPGCVETLAHVRRTLEAAGYEFGA